MVFSSQLFLYGFLPIFFSLYFLIDDRRKNWLVLTASLIFYGVGAGSTVLVLLASVWINQFLAIRIAPAPPGRRRALLTLGVTINLLGLAYYKYGSFLWHLCGRWPCRSWSSAASPGGRDPVARRHIILHLSGGFISHRRLSARNPRRRQLRRVCRLPYAVSSARGRADRALSRDQVGDAASHSSIGRP